MGFGCRQEAEIHPAGIGGGGCRVVGSLDNSRFGTHQQAGNRRPVPKSAADELGSIYDDIWHDRCAFLKFVAPVEARPLDDADAQLRATLASTG